MSKLIAVDCETNGLYGSCFAVAVIVRQNGVNIDEFVGRCPIEGDVDPWVADNVIPALDEMKVTHDDPRAMREALWEFWTKHRDGATVVAHMGGAVSDVFRQCINDDPARQWDGPYPLHNVSTALLLAEEDPVSVDKYNEKYGITVPFHGVAHHPMYNAMASAVAWEHLTVSGLEKLALKEKELEAMRKVFRDFASENLSTKEKARQTLIDTGIYNKDGTLSPNYGG